VVSFLDSATLGADIDLRLEEAQIPEGSHLSGRSLGDARIPQRTGLIVLALKSKRHAGRQVFNPGPDTRLSAGDVMIVLGHEEQVQQLREYARGGDAK
ncbi:MAG: TrkA C-terminal domain-containing protein, partial [Gemmatimonadota bacterium]